MTNLIEETYECNDYSRVTILSHSLGCLYTLWFLNQKSQEWKDKFILNWIPIAGVFGGAGTGIKQVNLPQNCGFKSKGGSALIKYLVMVA